MMKILMYKSYYYMNIKMLTFFASKAKKMLDSYFHVGKLDMASSSHWRVKFLNHPTEMNDTEPVIHAPTRTISLFSMT